MEAKDIRLGVVGAGFVGGALIRGFSGYNPITVYDKGQGQGSLEEVVDNSDVIFVSVPTPMRQDGSCDTRILDEVLGEIEAELAFLDRIHFPEVVIRSTVPPTWFKDAYCKYPNFHSLLFMPEFLTERTADLDFINAPRFIIGACSPAEDRTYERTRDVFQARFPRVRIPVMTWEEASLVKLGTNVFFTVKVSFFNELYRLSKTFDNVDPTDVINELINDGRIGKSHFQVPGPDGDFGWGGSCFPKDNMSYQDISFKQGVEPLMAEAAREVNDEVRTDRSWEKDIGRAVSED